MNYPYAARTLAKTFVDTAHDQYGYTVAASTPNQYTNAFGHGTLGPLDQPDPTLTALTAAINHLAEALEKLGKE